MTFSRFASHLARIESTASRNTITELLAKLIKESSVAEIPQVVFLSLGQIAPGHQNIEFNLAEKMLVRGLAEAFSLPPEDVRRLNRHRGDLGQVAAELNSSNPASQISVSTVFRELVKIANFSGTGSQEKKLIYIQNLLKKLDLQSTKFVIRIILGKLRLGFSDKTILDALSFIVKGDKSARGQIENAYNVLPDVGKLAQIITPGRNLQPLKSISPQVGTPILPALCQRLPTTEEIIHKMRNVAIEPKWDGQRIQAHAQKNAGATPIAIHLFTRGLEDVTNMFPDLVSALTRLMESGFQFKSVIFDGEIVAIDPKSQKVLPFQTMITRKRKYDVQEKITDVPVKYMIFDLLYLNGKSLMEKPFQERRRQLEKLPEFSRIIQLAPQLVTSNAAEIRKFLKQQINIGLEGIVAKRIDAVYIPGRTRFTWVKLKWEGSAKTGGLLDTVDCLVMGIYSGRGKRTVFGAGAFLVGISSPPNPLYPPISHSFLTISKIGTGLTDQQWKELKFISQRLEVKDKPKEYDVPKELTPDIWLTPELVAEIQADNITKSPLHTAKFALRFPRLVRWRADKRVTDITSASEIEQLYLMQ